MSRRNCAQCANGLVPCVCDDMPTRYEIRETRPGDFVPTMFVPMPQRGFVLESEEDKGEAYPDARTWGLLGLLCLIAVPVWYVVGWAISWVASTVWEVIK